MLNYYNIFIKLIMKHKYNCTCDGCSENADFIDPHLNVFQYNQGCQTHQYNEIDSRPNIESKSDIPSKETIDQIETTEKIESSNTIHNECDLNGIININDNELLKDIQGLSSYNICKNSEICWQNLRVQGFTLDDNILKPVYFNYSFTGNINSPIEFTTKSSGINQFSNFLLTGLEDISAIQLSTSRFPTPTTFVISPILPGDPIGNLGCFSYIIGSSSCFKFGPVHLGFDSWYEGMAQNSTTSYTNNNLSLTIILVSSKYKCKFITYIYTKIAED